MKIEPTLDDAIRSHLIDSVKGQGYAYYSDLYTRFGIDAESFEERQSLQAALNRLAEDDIAGERPLLPAAVIEKTTMLPGKPFFDHARLMGRYNGPLTGEKAERFHDAEMKRLGEFWKSRQAEKFSERAAAVKKTLPTVEKPRTTEEMVFRWEDTGMGGGEDHFALAEFADFVSDVPRESTVVSPKGASGTARYLLTVAGRSATLKYASFEKENKAAGMPVGTLRLLFQDDDRISVKSATWAALGGKEISARLKSVEYRAATLAPYAPAEGTDETTAESTAALRRRLRAAYGDRCAITGCELPEILDVVHIDRRTNMSHDHPANALLLRKDIAALWNAHLLVIDPLSRTARVATRARGDRDYAALDGRKVREPGHGFTAYAPDANALNRRWKASGATA